MLVVEFQNSKETETSQSLTSYLGLMDLCVRSSKRSASKLICRIVSSTITTKVPRSVTTVAVCCGASIDRDSNVKVSTDGSFPGTVLFFASLILYYLFHCGPSLHIAT